MNAETKKFALAIGVLVVIVGGGYAALVAYTGFTVPFSSVVSESMQHDDDRSEIGAIDTGDIVLVRDPSKVEIHSYVDGVKTGDSSFGKSGSVIIYNRDGQNPVIHRAILWLDYNGNGTWSAPSLLNIMGDWYYTYTDYSDPAHPEGKQVRVSSEDGVYSIRGTLTLNIDGKTPSINLDTLRVKESGFLTMGDNPVTNPNFDQSSGIVSHLVSMEDIRSVPVLEIPWLGSLKLLINGNDHLEHVPNSLPSLIMEIILVFSLLLMIDLLAMYKMHRQKDRAIDSAEKWKRD